MSEYTFFKGLKDGQKHFGEGMGSIVNSIVLTFVYVFGVGVSSLIAKLFRKKFLELKIDPTKNTYWTDLNIRRLPIKNYYRQF